MGSILEKFLLVVMYITEETFNKYNQDFLQINFLNAKEHNKNT